MAIRLPVAISTDGFYEELDTGDTLNQRGPITMNTNKITGLGDPTAAQDAATKAYVDAVASGLQIKQAVRVLPTADFSTYTAAGAGVGATLTAPDDGTAHNTQDGVLLALGNRVLVGTQGGTITTPDADNGIYTVTTLGDGAGASFTLTRATDFDLSAEVLAGSFMFVTEGTANHDTGWVLITNNPITLETTPLQFTLFSTTTAYTFDQGLSNTAGSIKVEVDTAADAQGAGAGGGSSGLEFDVNSAAGKLRAAVHATGGVERTATGLAAKLNGTSLVSAAGGLSVAYAPNNQTTYVSFEALTQYHPVAISTTNNQVYQAKADNTTRPRDKVIGLTLTTAGASGVNVQVQEDGVVAGALTGATVGTVYYLAVAGGLTTTSPSGPDRVIQVGVAKNATDLQIQIIDYGRRAA